MPKKKEMISVQNAMSCLSVGELQGCIVLAFGLAQSARPLGRYESAIPSMLVRSAKRIRRNANARFIKSERKRHERLG